VTLFLEWWFSACRRVHGVDLSVATAHVDGPARDEQAVTGAGPPFTPITAPAATASAITIVVAVASTSLRARARLPNRPTAARAGVHSSSRRCPDAARSAGVERYASAAASWISAHEFPRCQPYPGEVVRDGSSPAYDLGHFAIGLR
jgi:hypothetical protein